MDKEPTAIGAAAVFGKVVATIGAVIGNIIALLLIIIGVIVINNHHTQLVSAVVTQINNNNCIQDKNSATYSCVVSATYEVGGVRYTAQNITLHVSTPIVIGATITLRYDPKNPQDVIDGAYSPGTGWLMIGSGALLAGISTGIAILTYKSKAFAAGYGAVEGLGMIFGAN